MESKTISVVMPAYNAAATIEQSIKSVLEQTYKNIELIIVDDGSVDSTPHICNKLALGDKRIVYHRVPNGGVSNARNIGIALSKGSYISLLDSDDLYHRDKLLRQYELINESGADIIITGIQRFSVDGQGRKWLRKTSPPDLRNAPYLTLLLETPTEQYVLFNTALTKREVFDSGLLYDSRLSTGEDWDLWIRLGLYYSFASIDEPLFFYRKHEESVTAGYGNFKTLQAHLEILKKNRRSSVPNQRFHERVDSKYLEFLSHSIYSGQYSESLRILSAGVCHGTVYKRKRFYEVVKDLLWKRLAFSRTRTHA